MMAPSRARLRMSGGVNIVWDGNSLLRGENGATQWLPDQVAGIAPVAGSGAAVTNVGVSGQTWRMMNGLDGGSSADVDAAWVAGKTNVLIAWETTNDIANIGRTPQQAADDCRDYLAARLSVHPWLIVLATTLPRQAPTMVQADTDTLNGNLAAADQLMRAGWRSWGAHALAEVRPAGGPFAFPDFTPARWAATSSLWIDHAPSIHLANAGYAIVAGYLADAIRRLPARA